MRITPALCLPALCLTNALAATACGSRTKQSPSPATAAQAAPGPGAKLPEQKFHFGDADLSGSVEASGPPYYTMQQDIAMVDIPVGSMGRMLCAVYARTLDVGGALSSMRDLIDDADLEALDVADVTAVKEAPLVVARALYRHRAVPDHIEEVQFALRPHPTLSVVCMRTQPDQLAAFQRIATGFIASLARATEPESDRMVQIDVTSSSGVTPNGFTWRRVAARSDGGRIDQEITAFIISRPRLVTLDFVSTQLSDSRGRLQGMSLTKAKDGELFDHVVARREGSDLVYERERDGHSTSGSVACSDPAGFPSNILISHLIRDRLVAGQDRALELEEYHPMFDPAAAMRVHYQRATIGRTINLTYGGRPLSITVDDQGLVERLDGGTGPDAYRSTRILRRGTP